MHEPHPAPPPAAYSPTAPTIAQIANDFTYHPPRSDQVPRYEYLRSAGKRLALDFVQYAPPSRERSLALTHLEEALFYANAAIARNEKPEKQPA